MKRVITIDGSTTSTGVAVFKNKNYELEEVFVLEDCRKRPKSSKMTKKAAKELRHQIMEERVLDMIRHLNWILNKYKPDKIIMEDTYSDKDPYAYKMLCRMQGAMLEYAINNNTEIRFWAPNGWRSALGISCMKEGGGRNAREDYKHIAIGLVEERFQMTVKDDIAEAICMGLAEQVREEKDLPFS